MTDKNEMQSVPFAVEYRIRRVVADEPLRSVVAKHRTFGDISGGDSLPRIARLLATGGDYFSS